MVNWILESQNAGEADDDIKSDTTPSSSFLYMNIPFRQPNFGEASAETERLRWMLTQNLWKTKNKRHPASRMASLQEQSAA